LLKEAMAAYRTSGSMAVMKEANSGKFHISPAGYLLVLDESGRTLIHGESSRFIGVNMSNIKDAYGNLYIKEALDSRAKGKGKVPFTTMKGGNPAHCILVWEVQDGIFFGWITVE
jgi:signal transduction histidine kinase